MIELRTSIQKKEDNFSLGHQMSKATCVDAAAETPASATAEKPALTTAERPASATAESCVDDGREACVGDGRKLRRRRQMGLR